MIKLNNNDPCTCGHKRRDHHYDKKMRIWKWCTKCHNCRSFTFDVPSNGVQDLVSDF